MTTEEKAQLELLVDLYEYGIAYRYLDLIEECPEFVKELLYILKERRELNIQPAQAANRLLNEDVEAEQIANYLLDLHIKWKKKELIDFVRAVSPVLYRLYLRVIAAEIPNLKDYIIDTKDQSYDTWDWDRLAQSDHKVLRQFRSGRIVTSHSLAQLIQLLPLSEEVKKACLQLRDFERSVRNPLAHLIKPFDEEELRRTTNFSSKIFLETLIQLARNTGIHYPSTFYFDQVNQELKSYLK